MDGLLTSESLPAVDDEIGVQGNQPTADEATIAEPLVTDAKLEAAVDFGVQLEEATPEPTVESMLEDTVSEAPAEAQAEATPETPADAERPAEPEAQVESAVEVADAAAAPETPEATDTPAVTEALTADAAASPATTEAAPKPKRVKKDAGPKKLSALDAAAQVLQAAGKAMTAAEMVEEMSKQGLWSSPNGATPAATLYCAILREQKKGAESRFEKTDRGKFAAKAP